MKIVKAKETDLDIINLYLENMRISKLNQYSFHLELRKVYIIKVEEQIIAFICYLMTMENVELEAIYVKPAFRKRGYASKLIKFMINDSISRNCKEIFLEVRKTNKNAIDLYQRIGFQIIDCRNQYYGLEDGLIMKKELRCNNE